MILYICDNCGRIIRDDETHQTLRTSFELAVLNKEFTFCNDCFNDLVAKKASRKDVYFDLDSATDKAR